MLLQTFAHFEGQVQPRKIRIGVLEQLDHAQALPVMIEAAVIAHAFGQNFFAGMPEGRMAEIVRQRDRFGQIFVQRNARAIVRLIDATSIECVSRVRK